MRAETGDSVQGPLLDFLRSRRLLLVIDNCEHLVDACARLVEAILRACPDVSILATSREPLHIAGETAWRVPTLAEPEAVRLFADRALAASGLDVTRTSTAAVERVCQQVDGIPLAIELAAARTGVLSVDQIATRLDNRFRLLVGGGRTAPAAPADAAGDPRLELRAAARVRAAAAQLPVRLRRRLDAGGRRIRRRRGVRYTDRGRVRAIGASGRQVAGPGRPGYGRAPALSAARKRARICLRTPARKRHGGGNPAAPLHLLRTARRPGRNQRAVGHKWSGVVDATRSRADQCTRGAGLGLSEDGDPKAALRLVGHLGHYWYTHGDRAEGHTWLTRALARVPEPGLYLDADDARAWAWATVWAGGLAHGRSDYDRATRQVNQAMAVFARLDDQRGVGWCLHFLGHIARAQSELPRAAEDLAGAVAAFRAVNDEVSVVLPLAALGFTVCLLGDQPRATELCEQAVSVAREAGATGRLTLALIYRGQVANVQGEARRAAEVFQEGLQLAREWDSAWGMAECLEGLAVSAASEAQPERAARLLGSAARLRETIGAPVHPVDRADHERAVEVSRSALGAAAFETAWASGQAMSLEDVIDYSVSSADAEVAPAADKLAQLTAREREVAMLIARGLSNRQIAETLVIAERTVTNHVEHIFDKLGFRSRAQVATWITEQSHS